MARGARASGSRVMSSIGTSGPAGTTPPLSSSNGSVGGPATPAHDKEMAGSFPAGQRYIDEASDRENPITIAATFHIAREHGWPGWSPPVVPTGSLPVNWPPSELQVSFSNIPHRRWLYGVDLVRGDITLIGSPGRAGKTSLRAGKTSLRAGKTSLRAGQGVERDRRRDDDSVGKKWSVSKRRSTAI